MYPTECPYCGDELQLVSFTRRGPHCFRFFECRVCLRGVTQSPGDNAR
jgi:hypothetical protein